MNILRKPDTLYLQLEGKPATPTAGGGIDCVEKEDRVEVFLESDQPVCRIGLRWAKPTLEDYPGLRYYEEDKEVIEESLINPQNEGEADIGEKIRDIMHRWMKLPGKEVRYTFKVDDAIRIARNENENQDKVALRVDDNVTVCYEMFWEDRYQGKGLIYPEVILASESVK